MTDPKKKPVARTSVPQSGYQSSLGILARLASLAPSAKKAEDDEDEDDKAKKKVKRKGKKPEDGDDEDPVSDDDDDDQDVDEADDDGDEESDEDDKKNKRTAAARGRERGRIAAIITSKAAQRSDVHRSMAMSLALSTELTRAEAIVVLSQTPAPDLAKSGAQAARQRLGTAPNPDVGTGDGGNGSGPTLAQQIIAAGKKRRGEA